MAATVFGLGVSDIAASKKGWMIARAGFSPAGKMPKYLSYLNFALLAKPKKPISTMSCCMAIGIVEAMIGVA